MFGLGIKNDLDPAFVLICSALLHLGIVISDPTSIIIIIKKYINN